MIRLLATLLLAVPLFAQAECHLKFSLPNDVAYSEEKVVNFVVEKIRPKLQENSSLVGIDILQQCDDSPPEAVHLKMDMSNYYILSIQGYDLSKNEYTYQTSHLPLSLKDLNTKVSAAVHFESLGLTDKQNTVKELAFFLAESARFSDVENVVAQLAGGQCNQDWLQYAHLVRRWSKLSDFSSAMQLDNGAAHGGSKGHLIAPVSTEAVATYNEIIKHGADDPKASLIDKRDWNNPVVVPAPACRAAIASVNRSERPQ